MRAAEDVGFSIGLADAGVGGSGVHPVRSKLVADHHDAAAAFAGATAVEVDEVDVAGRSDSEFPICNLENLAGPEQCRLDVRVGVQQLRFVSARQVGLGVGPRGDVREVIGAGVEILPAGRQLRLHRDHLAQHILEIGLQVLSAVLERVVDELLEEDRAGGVGGEMTAQMPAVTPLLVMACLTPGVMST